MVGHKDPCMNIDAVFFGVLLQPGGICREIPPRGEAGLTVITALDEMKWNARQANPGQSGHMSSLRQPVENPFPDPHYARVFALTPIIAFLTNKPTKILDL